MSIFNKNTFVVIFGLMLGWFSGQLQAEEFRYRYINMFDKVPLPPSGIVFSFFDAKSINDRGQVSGDINNCGELTCETTVGIYQNGQTQVLQPGISGPLNQFGNIGGSVVINPDPLNFLTQAAIFSKNGIELIAPLLGEITSNVIALNDKNTALVASLDNLSNLKLVVYAKGKSSLIDFGQNITTPTFLEMNNKEVISGTTGSLLKNAKAFRYNPQTGLLDIFNPLPGDDLAWGQDINAKGNVLGYSFVEGKREQIGFWDRLGKFHTYFVEGTPEFPTVSNQLVFNDKNLIAISRVISPEADRNNKSYLVPKPGVRLNIADLVVNKNDIPPDAKFSEILSINNHGDMVGLDFFGTGSFLLQRLDFGKIILPATSQTQPVTQLLRSGTSSAAQSMIRQFYSKKLYEKYRKDRLK